MTKIIRIYYQPTGELIAEGKRGWQITPFEGNYYIHPNCLRSTGFYSSWIPGICFYKFVYFWLHWRSEKTGQTEKMFGWRYVLPNPLLPFIWFRIAVSGSDYRLRIESFEES